MSVEIHAPVKDPMSETSTHTTREAKTPWFDPVSAILMAIASLATAWCSYQSSLWGGLSGDLGTHADKLERQISTQHLEARQIEAMQMRLWMEVVDAHIDGDIKLERFYTERITDELKPAFDKWLALNPYDNPTAPPHPFVPQLYVPRFEQEIRAARTEATQAAAQSSINGRVASGFLGNTVILATVLFFVGTAGKFDRRRVRWSSLAFAIALFLYAAVRMFMLPVA
jgi:hypothetical protein